MCVRHRTAAFYCRHLYDGIKRARAAVKLCVCVRRTTHPGGISGTRRIRNPSRTYDSPTLLLNIRKLAVCVLHSRLISYAHDMRGTLFYFAVGFVLAAISFLFYLAHTHNTIYYNSNAREARATRAHAKHFPLIRVRLQRQQPRRGATRATRGLHNNVRLRARTTRTWVNCQQSRQPYIKVKLKLVRAHARSLIKFRACFLRARSRSQTTHS